MQVLKIFAFSIVLLFGFSAFGGNLWRGYDESLTSNRECKLVPGKSCYHSFTSAQTTTTADSEVFKVSACVNGLSHFFSGDGTATLNVLGCLDEAGTDCHIDVQDRDQDGDIDSTDEAIVIDGETIGRRGSRGTTPETPWQKIDVLVLPASGTLHHAVTCL